MCTVSQLRSQAKHRAKIKQQKDIAFTSTDSVILADGSTAEFDEKLNFGNKDSTIPINARSEIENWENKRRKNKIEYAYATTADGMPLGAEIKGAKHKVSIPSQFTNVDGAIVTHIHPRGNGYLSGTFSEPDLSSFSNRKCATIRAVAKEGTYSISKSNNFDKSGFQSMIKQANIDFNKRVNSTAIEINNKYIKGEINYQDYYKQRVKAFNNELVRLHETYRGNQKKYGYIYTLEQI